MTYTPPTPDGGEHGFARAITFVGGLFAFVVVAMTDLFVLLGLGGGTESCGDQACRDWYDTRLPWVFGMFVLSFIVAFLALVLPPHPRRRYAVAIPVALLAITLQATGFLLCQNGPAA